MTYKQRAIEKLEEAELNVPPSSVIAATFRQCITIPEEIPDQEDCWFPASVPPEKSMKVIICSTDEDGTITGIQSTGYSAKNKAFNSYDFMTDHEFDIHPAYWKPMPRRVEELKIYDPNGSHN